MSATLTPEQAKIVGGLAVAALISNQDIAETASEMFGDDAIVDAIRAVDAIAFPNGVNE